MMRQVVLDTESTGLSPKAGHRLIEIGCVELEHRKLTGKTFQTYLNPKRDVEAGAFAVHGIGREFLEDKPEFKAIKDDFLAFIGESELIIHNAPFDLAFINNELQLAEDPAVGIEKRCSVVDTLVLARKRHPGQRNNLDALCKRYGVSNAHRKQHGALLDAELLSDVYLAMTAGQKQFVLEEAGVSATGSGADFASCKIKRDAQTLKVIHANQDELAEHEAFMRMLEEGTFIPPKMR